MEPNMSAYKFFESKSTPTTNGAHNPVDYYETFVPGMKIDDVQAPAEAKKYFRQIVYLLRFSPITEAEIASFAQCKLKVGVRKLDYDFIDRKPVKLYEMHLYLCAYLFLAGLLAANSRKLCQRYVNKVFRTVNDYRKLLLRISETERGSQEFYEGMYELFKETYAFNLISSIAPRIEPNVAGVYIQDIQEYLCSAPYVTKREFPERSLEVLVAVNSGFDLCNFGAQACIPEEAKIAFLQNLKLLLNKVNVERPKIVNDEDVDELVQDFRVPPQFKEEMLEVFGRLRLYLNAAKNRSCTLIEQQACLNEANQLLVKVLVKFLRQRLGKCEIKCEERFFDLVGRRLSKIVLAIQELSKEGLTFEFDHDRLTIFEELHSFTNFEEYAKIVAWTSNPVLYATLALISGYSPVKEARVNFQAAVLNFPYKVSNKHGCFVPTDFSDLLLNCPEHHEDLCCLSSSDKHKHKHGDEKDCCDAMGKDCRDNSAVKHLLEKIEVLQLKELMCRDDMLANVAKWVYDSYLYDACACRARLDIEILARADGPFAVLAEKVAKFQEQETEERLKDVSAALIRLLFTRVIAPPKVAFAEFVESLNVESLIEALSPTKLFELLMNNLRGLADAIEKFIKVNLNVHHFRYLHEVSKCLNENRPLNCRPPEDFCEFLENICVKEQGVERFSSKLYAYLCYFSECEEKKDVNARQQYAEHCMKERRSYKKIYLNDDVIREFQVFSNKVSATVEVEWYEEWSVYFNEYNSRDLSAALATDLAKRYPIM